MFEGWEDFYLMTGSSAAALIGLMFVVVTLMAGIGQPRAERGEKLYLSPTVFHFALIFLISAAALWPHGTPDIVGLILAVGALAGLIYMIRNVRALSKEGATEHWSDFWFYAVAPLASYALLGALAAGIRFEGENAPALVGLLQVAMLLLTIRNAWDLVTWIAPRVDEMREGKPKDASASLDPPPSAPS